MAGISEGGAKLQTRGAGSTNVDQTDNHAKHLAFTSNTKAAIRIDGTWKGKADGTYTKGSIIKGSIASEVVTQTTTATIKNETSNGSKHNAIEFTSAEQLYWDDYGTAAPENMGTGNGRDIGLSIYGAAVDGVTTAPDIDGTTGKKWNELTWTLDADQKTNDWKNKDLLISNNINTSGPDGTYKFDDRDAGKLLEFKHAMSKITIRLIANEGFPATGVGETTNKFASSPEVKLTGDEGDASTYAYANTVCTVNVTDGTYSNSMTPAVITMRQGAVQESQKTTYTAIYEALVAPGSLFGAPQTNDSKEVYPIIARINADGNIYYVTSEEIRAKMKDLNSSTDYKTESGKNYIITVKVNKTKIEVTATITDWIDVEAETVTPVINVSGQVGYKYATGSLTAFDFYMRENAVATYTAYGKAEGTADGSTAWQFKDASNNNTTLYWPTHNTHYHMRGVSPTTTTIDANKQIVVSNAQYNASTSPSNLMIGAPEIADGDKMCNNSDHTSVDMTQNGICARNNTINLNFRYVMSQVEVKLKSTGTVGKDLVDFTSGVKVDIVGGYDKARIQLDTRLHDTYTNSDKPNEGKYVMNARSLTSDETTNGVIKSAMHDIIVPQTLTDDMKFRITVTNSDGTTDVYETQLNEIYAIVDNTKTNKIAEWESGKHYIYELDIKKTEIKVTATITPWTEVTANQPVWF